MHKKNKDKLRIAMLGHKRIPSREGGVEIVVEELCTRMVNKGHKVTVADIMLAVRNLTVRRLKTTKE